jgi:hypothetical protein
MDDEHSFIFGALNAGAVYIAGVVDELDDRNVPHTIIWERLAQGWQRYVIRNGSRGLAAFDSNGVRTVVYMGADGRLKTRDENGTSREERVDAGDDAPSPLRSLTAIRVIGDHLYVGGMRRMLYRCALDGRVWERLDEGLRQSLEDPEIAGVLSFDGYSAQELYAVGFNGEIWWRDAGHWLRIDSPTSARLTAVRCTSAGVCFVGGAQGVLLVGRGNQWSVIDHEFGAETFFCIEGACGRWFLCADSGKVYEIIAGSSYALQRFEVPAAEVVSWIAADASALLFVGTKNVMQYDGQNWADVTPAPTNE